MKVIVKPETVTMSDEQIRQFARFIYNNIADVHKYIEKHRQEYEEWLKQENKKAKIPDGVRNG